MITIYHNPRCSKSRECLQLLELQDKPLTITKYLDQPLTKKEIRSLITKLKIKPIELVRQKEEIWTKEFAGKELTDEDVIDALRKHPILIERPIVVNGRKAVIARPAERIYEII